MLKDNDFFYKSLTSKVVDYIKTQIFLGYYNGGDRIIVAEVADKLRISDEPVRNAIKELKNTGLIEKIPRRGSFVVEFKQKDFEEIFDIRMLLENRVIDILIDENKLKKEDFQKLKLIVDEMVEITQDVICEEEKILELNNKDINFHKYLWQKSKSQRTMKMLEDLYDQLQVAMIMDVKLEGSLLSSAKKHYQILAALKNNNKIKAKKFTSDHIVTYKNGLSKGGSSK